MRHGNSPAPVPEEVIDELKAREDANGFVKLPQRPRFAPGDKVRVTGGAFCDCVGLYECTSSHERVAILLELLGRKVRISADALVIVKMCGRWHCGNSIRGFELECWRP